MAAKMTCAPLTSANVFRVLSALNARSVFITKYSLVQCSGLALNLRFTLVDVRKILIDETVPASEPPPAPDD